MKKITTLFKKDPTNLGRVINEINPENEWALTAKATRKYDGTSCAIINGELYKRYDARLNKEGQYKKAVPEGAISCQEADIPSGHHPHWIKCERNNPANKYHFMAFDLLENKKDGTYELCGEKVQGNPEGIEGHILVPHGEMELSLPDRSFEGIKAYLEQENIEGIVFHDGEHMCKIRKTDFGIKRG